MTPNKQESEINYEQLSKTFYDRYHINLPGSLIEVIMTEFMSLILLRIAMNEKVLNYSRILWFYPKWRLKDHPSVKRGIEFTSPHDGSSILTLNLSGSATHKSMYLNDKLFFELEESQFAYLYKLLYGKKEFFKKYWIK